MQVIHSEAKSRDQLRANIRRLQKQRDKENTTTKEGQKNIKELNKQIDQQSKALKATGSAYEKQIGNIGNYSSALDGLGGGLGASIRGLKAMTTAAKAFIATPLGAIIAAIVLALKSLQTFFKSSEEGQNALNKVTAVFNTIVGNLTDVVSNLGKRLFEAFQNPKQTLIQLGETLKRNIVNRFVGLLELIPNLGRAVGKLFKGEFKEAGKIAADAVAKVSLGVEDFTDKAVEGFNKATDALKEFAAENKREIEIAQSLADRQAELDKNERDTLVENAKLRRDIAEFRATAADKENIDAQTRLDALNEAIELENKVLENNQKLAQERLDLKTITNSLSLSTKEDLQEQTKLQAELINLETTNAQARKRLFAERVTAQREVAAELKKIDDELFAEIEEDILETETNIGNFLKEIEDQQKAKRDKELEDFEQAEIDKVNFVQNTTQQINNIVAAGFNFRRVLLDQQLNQELDAIGDNEAARERIEAKFARKRKRLAIAEAIISGAQMALNGFLTKPFIPAGLAAGALATTLAGVQIATIAKTQFRQGGKVNLPKAANGIKMTTLGGSSHAGGGVQLSADGVPFAEAERDENIYVVKKEASRFINAISGINQAFGGVSLTNKSRFMQDGGQGDISGQNIGLELRNAFKNVTLAVQVEDIKTGLSNNQEVINVGVVG